MSRNTWDNDDETGCLVIILCVIGLIGLLFLGPAITMWLWNWVAVDLFGAPAIGYWTAFGLQWLCNLLFGLQWLCNLLFGRAVTVKGKS